MPNKESLAAGAAIVDVPFMTWIGQEFGKEWQAMTMDRDKFVLLYKAWIAGREAEKKRDG